MRKGTNQVSLKYVDKLLDQLSLKKETYMWIAENHPTGGDVYNFFLGKADAADEFIDMIMSDFMIDKTLIKETKE